MANRQLFSLAENGQGGDKQALLEAINKAASGYKPGSTFTMSANNMMKDSRVNHQVAKDLVSTVSRSEKVANMNDFEQSKTLLQHKAALDRMAEQRTQDDELRSIKSEFDYGSKKKFVDILGNVSRKSQINRLRAEHGGANQGTSEVSYRSQASRMSRVSKATSRRFASQAARGTREYPSNAIAEQEQEDEQALQALGLNPDDFTTCNMCTSALNEDEKIINARFVKSAVEAGEDISMFPICVKCNFDNMVSSRAARQGKYENLIRDDQPAFFPTNKKLFNANQFQNSEEFKQLGTLHKDNRTAAYYPQDEPNQTTGNIPVEGFKTFQVGPVTTRNADVKQIDFEIKRNGADRSIELSQENRRNYLKNFVGKQLRDENQKSLLINQELGTMKRVAPRSTRAASNSGLGFPTTTNQDFINQEVFQRSRPVDKVNFKRKNEFNAYVNSMFNSGVFTHPWQDMC